MSILLPRFFRVGARSLTGVSKRPINRLVLEKRRVIFNTTLCAKRFYTSDSPPSGPSFPPDQLLEALEMMADAPESLPPIPPGQHQERFIQAYLLAHQIIMYLAARPATEAETFAAIFQSASVPNDSAVARGRAGVLKITKQIVELLSAVPSDYLLWSSHPEIFQSFKALQKVYAAYVVEGENVKELESWSRFFVGLRTELVEFIVRMEPVAEELEKQQ